jgi:DNA-binding NarL/FixJ family response regulator
MAYRIAIIEDNVNFLESLNLYLEKEQKIKVVCTAGSVEEFLDMHERPAMDAVLLDIQLPGMSGIEGVPQIKKNLSSGIPVIILTINEHNEHIHQALEMGADGYLLKTEPLSAIYHQMLAVMAHEQVAISRKVFHALKEILPQRTQTDVLLELLTQREKEITREVLQGHDYKTIAANLNISTGTVNFHLKSIYLKLDVNSKTELMALFLS